MDEWRGDECRRRVRSWAPCIRDWMKFCFRCLEWDFGHPWLDEVAFQLGDWAVILCSVKYWQILTNIIGLASSLHEEIALM